MTTNTDELKFLAAMAYAESSANNVYEEMAGIASVLVRQRDARGHSTMQDFTTAEPSYSYVVTDGNPRFAELRKFDAETIDAALEAAAVDVASASSALEEAKKTLNAANTKEKSAAKKEKKPAHEKRVAAQEDVKTAEKNVKVKKAQQKNLLGYKAALMAAENAISGGNDFSNGAYFWDGADIRTNYSNHFKVKHGIKIMDQSHNVVRIKDSTKLVILTKTITKKTSGGTKTSKSTIEIGRYDHVYESTAGKGGTIFWKHNPEYMRVTGAKAYK